MCAFAINFFFCGILCAGEALKRHIFNRACLCIGSPKSMLERKLIFEQKCRRVSNKRMCVKWALNYFNFAQTDEKWFLTRLFLNNVRSVVRVVIIIDDCYFGHKVTLPHPHSRAREYNVQKEVGNHQIKLDTHIWTRER